MFLLLPAVGISMTTIYVTEGDIVVIDYRYSDYKGEVTDIRRNILSDPKLYGGRIHTEKLTHKKQG